MRAARDITWAIPYEAAPGLRHLPRSRWRSTTSRLFLRWLHFSYSRICRICSEDSRCSRRT